MFKKLLKTLIYKLRYSAGFPSELYFNREFNPHGVYYGKNSFIVNPMKIEGGNCISLGNNSRIGKHSWVSAFQSYGDQIFSPRIVIGNNVSIGSYFCLTSIREVIIEDGCLFSECVYISDHAHGLDPSCDLPPVAQPLLEKGSVVIGQNTFIGYRACILPGVKLGKNCVVGANSVVTKSFDDYSMIAGVPAKIIKKYSFEERKWVSV
jgi:lipopolysaccharide O-acetyltransferase